MKRTPLTAPTPGTSRSAADDRRRRLAEAVLRADREVAGERAVDRAIDRALQPGGEDRHERDERDADHERRRRDGRARRVAGRVLAREAAADAGEALQRRADDRRDRPHELRAEQRDAEEDRHRAAAERRRGAAARRAAEEAVRDDARAGEAQQRRRDEPAAAGLRRGGEPLAQRRDRRDARRAQRRDDARDDRHDDADEQRHDDRARRDDRVGGGQVGADRRRTARAAPGTSSQAAEQPEQRRDQADDGRLEHDRAQDLAARRAEHPQQRELARALRDRDRERVVDDERADEQRDPAEDEQRRAEEAELVLEVGGLRLGVLGAGADGHGLAGERDAARAPRSCVGVTPSSAATEIPSSLPLPAGERLRGRQRRDRDRVARRPTTASPNFAAPVSVKRRAPSSPTILTRSPSLKPCSVEGLLVEADLRRACAARAR